MAEQVLKDCKVEDTDVKENQERAVEAGLWFEDGNIILIAQYTPFKVHRSLLSRESDVFRDMFNLPSPVSQDEMMDGIPVIYMSDHWRDLCDVLSALYHGQQ